MQRKIPSILLTFALASILFFTLASAKITILYPSQEYYAVANATLTIRWKADDPAKDPTTFQIYIRNPKISTLGGHSLANNVPTAKGQVDVLFLQDFLRMSDVRDGFIIYFTKLDNIEVVYAESEAFEVKESGTKPAEFKDENDESDNADDDDDDDKDDDDKDKKSDAASAFKSTSLGAAFTAVALTASLASILI